MSLRSEFEKMRRASDSEEDFAKLEKGREAISHINENKISILAKLESLKDLLNNLEESYPLAKKSLEDLKDAKEEIENLLLEYSDSLSKQGISSVSDVLSDKELSQEEDVVDYKEKGASAVTKDGERGILGKKVEKISELKKTAKEELPDLDLDFRGRPKGDEEISPREESFSKIKDSIEELEEQLLKIKEEEELKKSEYLPDIKEMVNTKIDDLFSSDENLKDDIAIQYYTFLNNDILTSSGDEFWPDVKSSAIDLIKEKCKEKNIRFNKNDIDESLDAEKLIFDVENLRRDHEDLLKKEEDVSSLSSLNKEIIGTSLFLGINKEVSIKDKKIYPQTILKQVEYFRKKNPEALAICEKAKNDLLTSLKESKDNIKSGVFTGGKNKDAMQKTREILDQTVNNLVNIEIPKNVYSQEYYELSDALSNASPELKDNNYDWHLSLKKEVEEKFREAIDSVNKIYSDEEKKLSKVRNDLYNFSIFRDSEVNIGGFKIPVLDLEELYQYKNINNKEKVDLILSEFEGKSMSQDNWSNNFKEIIDSFNDEIKNYPDSENILNKFNSLLNKYESKFEYNASVIESKMNKKASRGEESYNSNPYTIQQKLFYSK